MFSTSRLDSATWSSAFADFSVKLFTNALNLFLSSSVIIIEHLYVVFEG